VHEVREDLRGQPLPEAEPDEVVCGDGTELDERRVRGELRRGRFDLQ
jgi:hypothetical protein